MANAAQACKHRRRRRRARPGNLRPPLGPPTARERKNVFVEGRLVNTLGWLYQELGDFARAQEADRESAEIGRRIKNANVEISAAINLGLDYLSLGDPRRALVHFEDCATRTEKFGFGAHRWRWSIHAAVFIAETLLALGESGPAAVQAEKALVEARETGSLKYVGKALAFAARPPCGSARGRRP